MAFNDDLMDALRKSVEYYNDSHDAEASLAKAASDAGFNLDQTERLVEKFNTARTISYFEHHPEDRTQNFDIASKEKVAEYMVGDKPQEKKASADEYTSYDYAQYYGDERNYRGEVETGALEKAGEAMKSPSGNEELYGYSLDTLMDIAHKDILNKEAEADRLSEAAGMVRDGIATELDSIVGRIKLGFDAGNRFALFKEACADNKEVFETVESMVPAWVKEEAQPYIRKYASIAVVDLQDLGDIQEKAEKVKYWMKRAEEFEQRADKFRKEASDTRSRLYKAAAGGMPGVNPNRPSPDSGGSDPDKKKKKNPSERQPEDKSKYVFKGFNNMAGKTFGTLAGNLLAKKPEPKSTELRDTIDNVARSNMLEDFIVNDPILSEADPSAVASAYASLMQSSPDVALNKEVVRAFLRQAVNSVAISPFDAKQLAEYEEKLLKGNLYRRADEHGMVAR